MLDNVIKTVNTWGRKSTLEQYGANLTFKNRNKQRYNWDYKADINELMEQSHLSHPDIPNEFPGVRLDSNFDQDTSSPAILEEIVDDNTHAAAAATNTGTTQAITEEVTEEIMGLDEGPLL